MGALVRRSPAEVRLPCMVFAAVGELEDGNAPAVLQAIEEMRQAPGVVNVLTFERDASCAPAVGVAVVARGFWLARQCLVRLIQQCGAHAGIDSALNRAAGAMEPTVARGTAQFTDGQLHLWLACSEPVRVIDEAAQASGLPACQIKLRQVGMQEGEVAPGVLTASIALARQLQPTPVQVVLPLYAGVVQAAPCVPMSLPQSVLEAMGLTLPAALAA